LSEQILPGTVLERRTSLCCSLRVNRSRIIGNLSPRVFAPQEWYRLGQIGARDRTERFVPSRQFYYPFTLLVRHARELRRWEVQPGKNGSKSTTARAGTSSSSWHLLNYRAGCRRYCFFYYSFRERQTIEEFWSRY